VGAAIYWAQGYTWGHVIPGPESAVVDSLQGRRNVTGFIVNWGFQTNSDSLPCHTEWPRFCGGWIYRARGRHLNRFRSSRAPHHADGLHRSPFTRLCRTRRFVWLATEDGLVRYDGHGWSATPVAATAAACRELRLSDDRRCAP